MDATTTSTPQVERSQSEILEGLNAADARWRESLNTCRPGDPTTVRRYLPDGSFVRVCVANPLDLHRSGLTGVSAGRGPIPTQRCTSANRVESDKTGGRR